jgi:iron(III) transport system permease protein
LSLLQPIAARAMSRWDHAALAVAVLVGLPVAALAVIAGQGGAAAFQVVSWGVAGQALFETGLLVAGVVAVTSLIGVGAAWLVTQFAFPGRNLLGFALILPFAMPTYIAAYAAVEFLDYFGPVQGALRALVGFRSRADYWFPEARSLPGAILITALVLYPYVYVSCRAAFAMQGSALNDAARLLGASRWQALVQVVLPVVWPALAAGLTLVTLETLNDIGASQHLGVQTLTVVIYSTWLNKGSLAGAAQLALLMLLVVLLVIWAERLVRSNQRFAANIRNHRPIVLMRLTGWRAALACLACAVPVALGFCVPAAVLIRASLRNMQTQGLDPDTWHAMGQSVLVAGLATGLVLGLAGCLSLAGRFTRKRLTGLAIAVSGIGYALPGTVLVIGLLPLLGSVDRIINDIWISLGGHRLGLIVSGSVTAIVMAYTIRFMAIGLDQSASSLNALSRNIDQAAGTLGCSRQRLAASILVPAMRPGLAGAAILVFVDCLKELPATLLLRPLNFETLSTLLYGHASRGSFEDGALAALLIVVAGLVPLVLMNRALDGAAATSRRS